MMGRKTLPLSQVYRLLEPGPVVLITTAYKDRANVMTLSWQTMIDFEPPILAIVMSDQNYSFDLLMKSKECVINIPAVDMAKKVVAIGNATGRKVDKFKKFKLLQEPASHVQAPLLPECYANIECKVIDTHMAKKYNLFILEGVKAFIRPTRKRPQMIHHCGQGVFVIDGKQFKLPSRKK